MRRFALVASAALLFVPIIIKSRTLQEIPDRAAFSMLSSSGKVVVKISGDVRHPGIYYVPANILAENAIIMAEPYRTFKLPQNSGTKSPLHNGSTLIFRHQPDGIPLIIFGVMTVSERLILKIPLDIETMNEADFDLLPGIGPALARRIILYRQSNGGILHIEDLKLVEGIGEKKYDLLKKYF